MTGKRILVWTQHLLGIGHLMRAGHLCAALAARGHRVVLASGGHVPPDFPAQGFTIVPLPTVRAKDALFDALVDEAGADATPALLASRAERLLALHDALEPDCIVTETFPFGRRLVQDEVLALLDRAQAGGRRPRIVASVRDVLQRPRKTVRADAMVALARARYDLVLVHGDRDLMRAEESFPELAAIGDLLHYTGYMAPPASDAGGARRGVIVSAGGGAVGTALIEAALAARPMTRLAGEDWIVVAGPLADRLPPAPAGVQVVRTLPNLGSRLGSAVLSVSQAGYNTITEILAGRTPGVVVPFETDREQEQIMRATRLAARGLVGVVRAATLSPERLAQAIDVRHALGMPEHAINLAGQRDSADAIDALLAAA